MLNTARIGCPTCGHTQEIHAADTECLPVCSCCLRELPLCVEHFQGEASRMGGIAVRLLGAISHLLPEQDRQEAYQWLLRVVEVEMG